MPKDPDEHAVVLFRHHAIKNETRSREEGRAVYEDVEICEIRFPGSKNLSVFPATAHSHWVNDPATGEQIHITYAERFMHQYRQFKAHQTQTKIGTPLAYAPFLTEARRAELRALNVYTVEQLAHIDGQELKNLGPQGRELKNTAIAYIEEAKAGAPNIAMEQELEALRAKNTLIQEDLDRLLKEREAQSDKAGDKFDDMTLDQLRDFIKAQTGHAPHGSINRKTLVRMAAEASAPVA